VLITGSIMVSAANDYFDWYSIGCNRGQAINVSLYHLDYDVNDKGKYNMQIVLYGPESEGSMNYVGRWMSFLQTRWETASTLCAYQATMFLMVVTNATPDGSAPSSLPTHYTLDITTYTPPTLSAGQSDTKVLSEDKPNWFQWYRIATTKDQTFYAKVTPPAAGTVDMDMYGMWDRGVDAAAGNQSMQPWFLNLSRATQNGQVAQIAAMTGDMDIYVQLWMRKGTGLTGTKFEVIGTLLPSDGDNTPADAKEITKTTSYLEHAQQSVDKFDWYKFTVDSGFTVDITFSLQDLRSSYWNMTIWDNSLAYVDGWFNTKDGHPYIPPDQQAGYAGNPISSAGITLTDWAPPSAGTYYISIIPFAQDPQGHMTSPPLVDQFYRLWVNLPNFGPENKSQIPDADIMEDQVFSGLDCKDFFSDNEGDLLTYNVKSDNKNVAVKLTGSNVTATPAKDWFGTANITVEATDGMANIGANTIRQTFLVTVNPVNDLPYVKEFFINFTMYESEKDRQTYPYNLNAVFGDIDSPMTFTYSGNTNINVRIDQLTKNVYFTARDLWFGEENITFTAKDEGTVTAKVPINIKVTHKNHGPTLVNSKYTYNVEMKEDDEGDYSLKADAMFEDIDTTYAGDHLTYRLKDPLPLHLNLTIMEDYTIAIISEKDWSGDAEFTVYAEDAFGATNETKIIVKVKPVNDPPVIHAFTPTKLDITLNEGDNQVIMISSVTDVDNDTKYDIRYSWYVNNEFQTGDNVRNHQFTFRTVFQPDDGNAAGDYHVKCVVSDGLASVEREWNITVVDVNQPPINVRIVSPQAGVQYVEGKPITFEADANISDPDGDSPQFKWVINQTGTELSQSRAFSYDWKNKAMNKELKPGNHKIDLIVTDGKGGESKTSVILTIKAKPKKNQPGFEGPILMAAVLVALVALGRRKFKHV